MNKEQMVVNAIRILSAEAVQKAKSGHPGMPMGAAAMAYAVWGREMIHNPADPKFVNRDRFVLSSGHGSMLIYSLLHLFGYGLTIDDLKGGYVLSDCEGTPDVLLMASGSEVEQCMGAQELLKAEGVKARVISMPSFELFEAQSDEDNESV